MEGHEHEPHISAKRRSSDVMRQRPWREVPLYASPPAAAAGVVSHTNSSAETDELRQVVRDMRDQLIKARDALGRGHELEVGCCLHIGRAWHVLNGTGVKP
jgi:hypothetical protein